MAEPKKAEHFFWKIWAHEQAGKGVATFGFRLLHLHSACRPCYSFQDYHVLIHHHTPSCIIIKHDNDRLGALVEVFFAVLVPNPTGLQREETGDDGQDNDGDFDDFVGLRTLQCVCVCPKTRMQSPNFFLWKISWEPRAGVAGGEVGSAARWKWPPFGQSHLSAYINETHAYLQMMIILIMMMIMMMMTRMMIMIILISNVWAIQGESGGGGLQEVWQKWGWLFGLGRISTGSSNFSLKTFWPIF